MLLTWWHKVFTNNYVNYAIKTSVKPNKDFNSLSPLTRSISKQSLSKSCSVMISILMMSLMTIYPMTSQRRLSIGLTRNLSLAWWKSSVNTLSGVPWDLSQCFTIQASTLSLLNVLEQSCLILVTLRLTNNATHSEEWEPYKRSMNLFVSLIYVSRNLNCKKCESHKAWCI